ncbi:MAG: SPOR domain-containing protein [Ignavibacteria bacterium]|nr:SPOR domain-containing protein [Ignavibacteria bacterium]
MINDENQPIDEFDNDDSFALENLDKYPGDLPSFAVGPAGSKNPDATPNTLKSTDDTSEAGTLYDAKSNEFDPEADGQELHEQLFSQPDALFSDGDTTKPTIDEGSERNNEIFFLDTEEAISQGSTDSISSDDDDTNDFIKQLQADLERSKAKKAAQPTNLIPQQYSEPIKKNEFTSVDDMSGTEEIDLSSIAAHHPSTYKQFEEEVTPAPELDSFPVDSDTGYSGYAQMAASMPAEAQPQPEILQPKSEPKAKKEKKDRKGVYMMVAAAMLIAAVGFGAFSFYPQLSQMLSSSPAPKDTLAVTTPKSTPTLAQESPKNTSASVSDSVTHTENSVIEKHEETTQENIKKETGHAEKPPVAEAKAPIEEAEQIPSKVKRAPAKEIKKQPIAPSGTEIPPKEPRIAKLSTSNRSNSSTASGESKQQSYTVQVYSTPSKDDADERLSRLISRNATNPTVSTQLIRGQKWYRVRFGNFTNRDEAEATAKQLGFSQYWIDRIR